MPQMGWTVQNAICDGNSHVAKEDNSCRVAAQSNTYQARAVNRQKDFVTEIFRFHFLVLKAGTPS